MTNTTNPSTQKNPPPEIPTGLPPITQCQYRRHQGRPAIDILRLKGNHPMIRLIKEPDGSITCLKDAQEADCDFTFDSEQPLQSLAWKVAALIAAETIANSAAKAHTYDRTLNYGDTRLTLYNRANKAILQNLNPPPSNPDPSATPNPNTYQKLLNTRARDTFRHRLADPDILAMTEGFHQKPNWKMTLADYNTTVRHQRALRALHPSQFNAGAYFCQRLAQDHQTPLNHPGQIIQAAKQALDITPLAWKHFLHIPFDMYYNLSADFTEKVRALCSILAQANLQTLPKPLLEIAAYLMTTHMWANHPAPDHELRLACWSHALNQALDNPQPADYAQLHHVADALRYYISNHLPWGNGNWQTLLERADRWTHDIRHGGCTREEQILVQQAKWDSLIEETTINGLTFRPITTGPSLASTGVRMGNCLPSYWRSCQQGSDRIFAVYNGTVLSAALQIYLHNGTWHTGQLEATTGYKVPKDAKAAAQQLTHLYQQAHDKLPGTIHRETVIT